MNVRRFGLRLAVGLLCFAVGWACAMLLGVASPRRAEVRRTTRVVIVPHAEVPDMPPVPHVTGCYARKMRHAHEWKDAPRHEEFETLPMLPQLDEHAAPLPPPPPPARSRRNAN